MIRRSIVAIGAGFVLASLIAVATQSTDAGAASRVQYRHVFQIVLENESEATSYPGSGTELDKLASQGVFFAGYYAVGHASLDNYVALASGQAPFSSTNQDCIDYHDTGGTVDSSGFYHPPSGPQDTGCVFPNSVKTLADQMDAARLSWRGYMEDMGNTPTRETNPCGQPAVGGVAVDPTAGAPDQTQQATSADQYAARHNPFPYFHSLIDPKAAGAPSSCAAHVFPLSRLAHDLSTRHIAKYNWITPNLCNDGHDAPCKGPGADANPGAGGLTSTNAFLAQIVPEIESSSAFRQGGLILITTDESSGDNSSCCGETGLSGIQTSGGGGKVGAVALAPTVTPHVSTCPYNHYALLRTWEDLFRLTPKRTKIPGSDGRGHLAHTSDIGVNSMLTDLRAASDPCGG